MLGGPQAGSRRPPDLVKGDEGELADAGRCASTRSRMRPRSDPFGVRARHAEPPCRPLRMVIGIAGGVEARARRLMGVGSGARRRFAGDVGRPGSRCPEAVRRPRRSADEPPDRERARQVGPGPRIGPARPCHPVIARIGEGRSSSTCARLDGSRNGSLKTRWWRRRSPHVEAEVG